MFTFESTDRTQVRRFRIAQFNGRVVSVKSGGSMITGHIRSVFEKASVPARWTITIVQSQPKIKPRLLRPAPRVRAFEDFY